jgi:exodeoxyribonuclease VII small subunit
MGNGGNGGNDLDLKSFETSFQELEDLVRKLESGALTLDESLSHYERGVGALKRCYRILDTAEKRLELLVREGDGSMTTKPCDLTEIRGEARGAAKIAPTPVASPGPAAPVPAPAPLPAPALARAPAPPPAPAPAPAWTPPPPPPAPVSATVTAPIANPVLAAERKQRPAPPPANGGTLFG